MGLAALASVLGCQSANEYVAPPPAEVTVIQPVVREVADYAEFPGTTRATATVDLRARISGYLKSIEFEDGAYVKSGQLLFVIEREPFEAALALATANLRKAEAALGLAEAEVKRAAPLAKRGALSEQEIDVKLATRKTAKAEVAAADAAVKQAEWNLSYTEITAPISGRIGRHEVDVGNLVESQRTMLTTIESFQPIHVYFYVSETDVHELNEVHRSLTSSASEAAPLKISLSVIEGDGFPFEGHLDFTETGIDPETGTQQRRAVLDNEKGELVPGMFVRVRLPLGKPEPKVLVQDRAIGSDQRGTFVLVVNDKNVVEYRPVELGIVQGEMRVINRGLKEGERVVLNGLQRARPGAVVKPTLEQQTARADGGRGGDVAVPKATQSAQSARSSVPVRHDG